MTAKSAQRSTTDRANPTNPADGTDGTNDVEELYSDSNMATAIDVRGRSVELTAKLFKMSTRKTASLLCLRIDQVRNWRPLLVRDAY
ncbi:hypothetical protein E4U13_006047 [Claviceps humidiphila]|uniref:Uncharacterized protein n=1 Tax=Claviceps humidiphila TaxID=1294629 RepID=A0A9P7Q4K1_9HYPO|nr:hypothetical protein E4U13_006047 [Claviceps humidiphila]